MFSKIKAPNSDSCQLLLFFTCLLAYATAYLSRDTFSAVMPNILSQTEVLKTDLGMVSTLFLVFYGSGQLISGILGDKTKPHMLVFVGLLVSGIVNFLFGFATEAIHMMVLWSINGLALSLLWAPIGKTIIVYMDDDHRKKALINITVSMPLGTFTALLLSAYLVRVASFRTAFHLVGIILIIVAAIWGFGTNFLIKRLRQQAVTQKKHAADAQSIRLNKLFIISGLLFITVAIMCNGVIRNGVSIWASTYLTEQFGLAEFVSILTSAIIPIINLGGIYTANYINNKTQNETTTSAMLFAVSAVSLVILLLIGGVSPFVAVLFLALTTFSMQGLNAIIMSFVPLYFAKYNKASTVSGFLNSCAYLASSIGSYTVAVVSTGYGWNMAIICWVAVTLLGVASCLIVVARWKKFKQM